MARTTLTRTTPLGAFGTYSANAADITMTSADVANKNQALMSGNQVLIIAQNTNAGAQTVTITSTADEKGRTGDITGYSLGAAELAVFGPFDTRRGWIQSDGYLYLEASHADVKFGVIVL